MMPRGYTKPLYVLPFDHRSSFVSELFGWTAPLTAAQIATITRAKDVIYDGFRAAVMVGVPMSRAGVLVDEQFGARILQDAAAQRYRTAASVERSGQTEFDFEFGDAFGLHIERFHPTFAKVLVRYNPDGDAALNRRQVGRLKRLSDYLAGAARSLFMFELLVPAIPPQLARVNGDTHAFDVELRPELMVHTIEELQDAGVEPDVWKLEGLGRRADYERMVAAARRGGRATVGCIILGRGEDSGKVRQWLTSAAAVPGFIGFAVGRTTFWKVLVDWRDRRITADAAVLQIAQRYRAWVDIFEATARP